MNRQNERSGFMKLEICGRIIPSKLRLYYHIAVHCHGKCLVFIPCGSTLCKWYQDEHFSPFWTNTTFLKMKYLTGKEGRRDCTLLYYCVQSSDYLRYVDILNHKIMPLIRLLIIQKCPMRKQTLSQEFRQNNIKSLRKLINYHSPIVFIFISIIYSLF